MSLTRSKISKPFFSVVIPALNEEKYLPHLLQDLSKQTFTDFEVIVVDGNSEDKTVTKAKQFEKKLPITVFTVSKRNVSHQRNFGAKNAKAQWLIFMDADNRIPPFFLLGLRYQLAKNPNTDFFTTWINTKATNQSDKIWERSINLSYEISWKILNKPQCFGALIGCKKSVFDLYPFDENQLFFEDVQFLLNLNKHGFKFTIFREPTFTYSLRRQKKEGKLKLTYGFLMSHLHYLKGGDFNEPYSTQHYPMLGGGYYTNETNTKVENPQWNVIQDFIKTASKKQLEQARSILTTIIENSL